MTMTSSVGLTHWLDILILVLYVVMVMGVGLWSLFRPNRGNVKSYFLAGGSMRWFAVGASLFSSNIGSEHFVGLAGAGASSGIVMGLFEWLTAYLYLLLAWLFLPVYISAGVFTLPEYLEKRHGGKRIRTYLSGLALLLYIVTKLATSMSAGSLFLKMALGWNTYLSLAVLLIIASINTILGGLTAVMYTDTFQTAVMLIGAVVVMVTAFLEVGGYANMEAKYMYAVPNIRDVNSTCGMPRNDAFHLLRDLETGDQPWLGITIQAMIGCLWYVCCDQVMVQRSLAAKSLSHAKGGSILSAYLKILPVFLMIFPGMISRILFPDEVACIDPEECLRVCGNPSGCSNIAYPKLVLELLPIGARGLLLAVMLSAIMSSLTSIFNSSSTIFTMDLWRRFRPHASEREFLIVGRLFVVLMVGIAILWLPIVDAYQGGRLFTYIVAVEGYIGSPIGVLFVLSVFWKRTTEQAAFWGIVTAHVLGIVRLGMDIAYPAPGCGQAETRPEFLYKIHFMYFAQILMLFTLVVMVIVSLTTKCRAEERLEGVTWWTKLTGESTDLSGGCDIPLDQLSELPLAATSSSAPKQQEPELGANKIKNWRTLIQKMCGISDASTGAGVNAIDVKSRQRFLRQSVSLRRVLDVNAVGLLAVVVFLVAYFH